MSYFFYGLLRFMSLVTKDGCIVESKNIDRDNNNDNGDDDLHFGTKTPEFPIIETQSLCFNCEENGTSKFLMSNIPHFREIIISSFECLHCGYSDNSVQFGGVIQNKGIRIELHVGNIEDLNLQVVKGDYATIVVPELKLEIPRNNRGSISTIEGILSKVKEDLVQRLKSVVVKESEGSDSIVKFLLSLDDCLDIKTPFTFIIDDPSGNSHLERLNSTKANITHYIRTDCQNGELGLNKVQETRDDIKDPRDRKTEQIFHSDWVLSDDNSIVKNSIKFTDINNMTSFQIDCSSCGNQGQENIVLVDIPYFKQIVLMSFVCDNCGYRNNEVKAANGIDTLGKNIVLKVDSQEDLSRDILKSDTCEMKIPELDFTLEAGSLGGRFTTVEGILREIYQKLGENYFYGGDSATAEEKDKWNKFLQEFSKLLNMEKNFTLILDDPAGCSYVQMFSDLEANTKLQVESYERNREQNELLGLIKNVDE